MSLRAGLLEGRWVAITEADGPLAERLVALGAGVRAPEAAARADEDQMAAWVAAGDLPQALVHDARPAFGAGGHDGLRSALDEAWIAARAVATGALFPAGEGGRLVFIAPAPGAGPLAQAARAGLESLARTLAVEWARHTITAVAVCPGDRSTEQELGELAAFLVSPAGGYLSGCRFDLGQADADAEAPVQPQA